jgi:catechol 2,3-dioxygenase-like lactoylglutathione lyase family enzyme
MMKWIALFLSVAGMNAFVVINGCRRHFVRSIPRLMETASTGSDGPSPVPSTHRLSHVMLKVPSVDRTVAYWTEQLGSVTMSRENDQGSLQSAFVCLGNGTSTDNCFALELVTTTDFQLGTCLSYIGVSMLLQFQNNLRGAASGETPAPQRDEPNGIPVKSSASAPGDYFCRLALKSNNLEATHDFYTNLFYMRVMAVDADMLCLRYSAKHGGVSTTLIFEKTTEEIVPGTCFDHVAIRTSRSVQEEYQKLHAAGAAIYMKPTEMFGSTVLGVRDPNGYKVVLASEVKL